MRQHRTEKTQMLLLTSSFIYNPPTTNIRFNEKPGENISRL